MRKIYIILFIALFLSCNNENKFQEDEISKIVFATNGNEGKFPTEVIEINSSMNIKYHGIKFTEKSGFFKGIGNEKFWDTLNKKFKKVNYNKLDTLYSNGKIDDGLYTEIFIYSKNKKKHISGSFEALPYELKEVYKWLMLSHNFKLIHTSDSLKFETQTEKPLKISDEKILFIKK